MDVPLNSDDVILRLAEAVDAATRMVSTDIKTQSAAAGDPLVQRRLLTLKQICGDQRRDLVATLQREFAKQLVLKARAANAPAGAGMAIASEDASRAGMLTQELANDIQGRINDEVRLIANRLFELSGKRSSVLAGVPLEAAELCGVLTHVLKKFQVDHDTQKLFYRMLGRYLPEFVEEALVDLLKRLVVAPEAELRLPKSSSGSGADGAGDVESLMALVHAEINRRGLPQGIAQFLGEHQAALAGILLGMPEAERMTFISLLLSTLDANSWEHKRDKNKQILPGVLKRLQEHASLAALPEDQWASFQAALSKWHTLLIRLTSKRK